MNIKAGQYVRNMQTGECKLVICVDHSDKRLLFSGENKWADSKDWRSSVALPNEGEDRNG